MENVILLGATGSVGKSVLDVIRHYPKRFRLVGVSANKNLSKLKEIIEEFSPLYACIGDESSEFEKQIPGIYLFSGPDGLKELVSVPEAGTIIIAISGIAGLIPTLTAIEADKKILTANKESIVAGGEIINELLRKKKTGILSLDSEHNSIFNLLDRFDADNVESITLTASGGPFREKEITKETKREDVLKHPTWDMGNFITVNSATMMNKGFEVIEAHHLFGFPYEKIHVSVHPQSLVHGIIRLNDGSEMLSAGPSDMRFPVASAMLYPEIPEPKFEGLSLYGKNLEFFEPDFERFPLLALAYACGNVGGIMPAVLNAANEIAVEKFLEGFLPFYLIPSFIAETIEQFDNIAHPKIEQILIADKRARIEMLSLINGYLEKLPPTETEHRSFEA